MPAAGATVEADPDGERIPLEGDATGAARQPFLPVGNAHRDGEGEGVAQPHHGGDGHLRPESRVAPEEEGGLRLPAPFALLLGGLAERRPQGPEDGDLDEGGIPRVGVGDQGDPRSSAEADEGVDPLLEAGDPPLHGGHPPVSGGALPLEGRHALLEAPEGDEEGVETGGEGGVGRLQGGVGAREGGDAPLEGGDAPLEGAGVAAPRELAGELGDLRPQLNNLRGAVRPAEGGGRLGGRGGGGDGGGEGGGEDESGGGLHGELRAGTVAGNLRVRAPSPRWARNPA